MVKIVIALIVVLAVSFSSIFPARAASNGYQKDAYSISGSYSLTPVVGGLYYSASGSHLVAPLYGIKFGYESSGKSILDSFGTEGTLAYFSAKSNTGNGNTTGYLFRIEETLPFTINSRLVPFAAVGVGGIITSSDTSTKGLPFFSYGAGLKYFFTSSLALRADVRHILALTINGLENFELSAGLSYYFGKEGKKKVVPVPEVKPPEKETKEKEKTPEKEKPKPKEDSPPLPPGPAAKTESGQPDPAPETAPPRGLDKAQEPVESAGKPFPPPSAAAPEEDCYYTLAARGIVNRRQLAPLLNKLKTVGRQTAVREETLDTEVYRLTTDCFKDMQGALRRQAQLDRRNRNSFIIRNGDAWCVIFSSYLTEESARQEQKRLAGKGLPVKIVTARIPLPVWRITSGRYADARQAEEAAKILAELGIETTVVKVCRGTADPDGQILVSELTIEFDSDRYDVKPKYFGQFKEITDTLKSSPASAAVIEGHTDITGTRRYNLKLSQRRAQSVKNILVKFGIDPRRISIKGFGPSRPVADNETIIGRRKNRRAVEVVIVNH